MILITTLPAIIVSRGVTSPARYAVIDTDGRGIGKSFTHELARYRLDDDSTIQAYDLVALYEIPAADTVTVDSIRRHLDSLLLTKKLKNYVIVYPDPEINDSVVMVSKSLTFKSVARYDRNISQVLSKIRLEQSNINLPVDSVLKMARRIDMIQTSPGGKTRDFLSIYFGALIFVMIIFVPIISFGQILMRSVIEEKNSRVIEVIISSASPFQLMMGKIMGLGAANLTQVLIWLTMGLILFSFRGAFDISDQVADIMFNPILIGYFVVFMTMAYIMYSTLFAMVGAVCTTDKETQNFVLPLTLSLIMPVMFLMYIVQEPDSTVTTVISFIPLLTPTMMVARLNILLPETFTFTDPVILEATLGVFMLLFFVLFLIWATARIFRIGILMYGKRATLPEIVRWVRHK